MQTFQITLNRNFTAATSVVDSSLVSVGDYFVNSQNSLGGGVVTEFNVNEFLENDKNQSITLDFFSYMTANTTESQFREIVYSDKKLSNAFNDFYNLSVLSGTQSSVSIISSAITNTSQVTHNNNHFFWNGYSPEKFMSAVTLDVINSTRNNYSMQSLSTFTEEESYYVPISINRNSQQIFSDYYDFCKIETSGFTGGVLHSQIQCFVDINLHTNSDETWNNTKPQLEEVEVVILNV